MPHSAWYLAIDPKSLAAFVEQMRVVKSIATPVGNTNRFINMAELNLSQLQRKV
jgi:hypothetical protein